MLNTALARINRVHLSTIFDFDQQAETDIKRQSAKRE
jgi:hypothetical protein